MTYDDGLKAASDTNGFAFLASEAAAARDKAYAPYSGFKVGAALLCSDGEIFSGCNVENASYSATCCAERTALFSAVAKGYHSFRAIAVCGGHSNTNAAGHNDSYCMPCGVCRQALCEFCGDDFIIISVKSASDYKTFTLGELLPKAFRITR